MKGLLAAAGFSLMLIPLAANAQQGRQATDDQESFKQSVQAGPSTPKRRQIIRSELSTRTNRGHNSTIGAAPR
jgi:hypothetical protein